MNLSENLCIQYYLEGSGFVGILVETVGNPGVEAPSFEETRGIQEEPPLVQGRPGEWGTRPAPGSWTWRLRRPCGAGRRF